MRKTIYTPLAMFVAATILTGSPAAAADATAPPQTVINPAVVKKTTYPKIVIYTVAWCPHCRELKEYLTTHDIPFINRDVELDAAAMEELTQKYKSQGVPVIVLGKDQEVLKGFSAEAFEKAASRVQAGK